MISYNLIIYIRRIFFVFIVGLFLWLILALFVNGILDDNSLISESISLIIAFLSFIIAYGTFIISIESKRPSIEISLDFNSRYQQVQLTIHNVGERAAKNVKISYSNKSIWVPGNAQDLTQIASSISTLANGHSIKKKLGSQSTIDINAQTTATVLYTDLSGIYGYTEQIIINLNDYKDSLGYEQELSKTLFELQQIPALLKAIDTTIKKK